MPDASTLQLVQLARINVTLEAIYALEVHK